MARIRTIKPEFWSDPTMAAMPFEARLLYVGMWNFADDHGAIDDDPDRIAALVFPRDVTIDVGALVDLLVAAECLDRCIAEDGRPFLLVRSWERHQRISHRAASEYTDKPYRKRAIPLAVRRQVAEAYGCEPGGTTTACCAYCGEEGRITWYTRRDGKPSGWVTFAGLELDHHTPEASGGEAIAENIVLACRACNRSKGAKAPESSDRWTTTPPARPIPPEDSGVLRSPPESSAWKGKEGKGTTSRAHTREAGPPRRADDDVASIVAPLGRTLTPHQHARARRVLAEHGADVLAHLVAQARAPGIDRPVAAFVRFLAPESDALIEAVQTCAEQRERRAFIAADVARIRALKIANGIEV